MAGEVDTSAYQGATPDTDGSVVLENSLSIDDTSHLQLTKAREGAEGRACDGVEGSGN